MPVPAIGGMDHRGRGDPSRDQRVVRPAGSAMTGRATLAVIGGAAWTLFLRAGRAGRAFGRRPPWAGRRADRDPGRPRGGGWAARLAQAPATTFFRAGVVRHVQRWPVGGRTTTPAGRGFRACTPARVFRVAGFVGSGDLQHRGLAVVCCSRWRAKLVAKARRPRGGRGRVRGPITAAP